MYNFEDARSSVGDVVIKLLSKEDRSLYGEREWMLCESDAMHQSQSQPSQFGHKISISILLRKPHLREQHLKVSIEAKY